MKHIKQREFDQSDESWAHQVESFEWALKNELFIMHSMMMADEETGVQQWVLPIAATLVVNGVPAYVMPRGGQM